MNRNKTIRTLFALFCVLVLTFALTATAFADGDPIAVVNKLSDFIFGLIRAVGIILLGFGVLQLGLSLKSHDPSQRANGMMTIAGGIVITFTKEILSWRLAERRGSREQYIGGLADIVEMLKGHTEPTIIHTDQGSVYASIAYNELIKDTNIVRSMSRAGKPTDNPVNESLNGWIKEELFMDFHIDNCRKREDVRNTLENYVRFYNEKRPCYAIGYDTPVNYRKRFYKGELEPKNTFADRVLSEEPKFVRKRRSKAISESVSTLEKENC